MQKMINPLFKLLAGMHPMTNAIANFVDDYKNEGQFAEISQELNLIKQHLGILPYLLNEDEIKLIDVFLAYSEECGMPLYLTPLTIDDLIAKTDFIDEKVRIFIEKLENESFIKRGDTWTPDFTLEYSIFYKSNLISQLFSKAANYDAILDLVMKYLMDEKNIEDKYNISVEKIMNEVTLNHFFINPILCHLKEEGVISYDKQLPPTHSITNYFSLNREKLDKFSKRLRGKN